MGLIDADSLEDRLQSLTYDGWNQGVSTSWADAHQECADMVDEQPTIEPERESGRWIGLYWFKCSECGRIVPDVRNGGWSFCPQCGAKMEEQDG